MSKIPIPTAPRAMLAEASSSSTASTTLSEQIFANAAKELYPRLVLYEALAQFKDDSERRHPSGDDVVEARRKFLDSFAYLCDVQKGGATVTAVGLQKLPHSNILWLAANEGIRDEIKTYAKAIRSHLMRVDSSTEETIEDAVFRLAVMMCDSRISTYNEEVRKCARNCRMQLRNEAKTDAVIHLRRRLRKLSEPSANKTNSDIIDYCYGMRGDEILSIKKRSKDLRDDFGKLAHYIGRLGATRSAAHHVVKGMIKVPSLRQISCIRVVDAPDSLMVAIDQEGLSPYEIVRGICQDFASQNPLDNRLALHNLVELDLPSGSNNIRLNMSFRNTIITRVHAELQIADKFSREGFVFVDDDKYIGCSKPACYFCFSWLSSHKHGYVPPTAHYKIIPGCRGPDNNINESGAAVLKDMYAKTCAGLGQDILSYLLKAGPTDMQGKYHYQSTEGSSYAQSTVSTPPLG